MKKGGGKAKGSAFEREVCRRLSLWVSGGEKEDLFWRSAMSGGRATVGRKRGAVIRQAGDIASVSPEGHSLTDHYFIEAKAYRSLQIDRFLILGQGRLMKFWKIASADADKHGKKPLLIARQNGFPIILVSGPDFPKGITDDLPTPIGKRNDCFLYFLDQITGSDYKRSKEGRAKQAKRSDLQAAVGSHGRGTRRERVLPS